MKSISFFISLFIFHVSFGQNPVVPVVTYGLRIGGNYSKILDEYKKANFVIIPGMRLGLFADAQTNLPGVKLEGGIDLEQKGARLKFEDVYILTLHL